MTKLLNRIALIVSLSMWFFITSIFLNVFWIWLYIREFYILIIPIFSIIFWLIFKKIFLSEIFIKERLEFFTEWIEQKIKNNLYWKKTEIKKEKLEVIEEDEEETENEINFIDIINEPETENEINNNWQKENLKTDYKEEKQSEQIKTIKPKIKKDSLVIIYIKSFFKENLLAKIGSMLVFLWVLFLLSLMWKIIPSIWKIIIWFFIWFWVYYSWILLHKKWYTWEAKILLWTWVLINFLVILWWKHILENNVNSTALFSTWITFLFLILNSIFWIVTSFAYKSKTLLLFSFIFAYVNPFLIWWEASTPYTLIGYSMIVSIWWLIVWIKENNNFLKISSFILWNILFLIAPFGTEIWWISKFVFSWVLWLLVLISLYKSKYKNLWVIFIINYLFIIIWLIIWGSNSLLNNNLSFISYLISILFFFWVWILFYIKKALTTIVSIIVFPIIIIIWLIFSWSMSFIEISLWIIVLSYLIAFIFLENFIPNIIKYFFFLILWIFIVFINSYFSFTFKDINFYSFILITFISFIFLLTSYYFSRKKWLEYLYTIGTIWWILTLLPIVNFDFALSFKWIHLFKNTINAFTQIWIWSLILFWIINTIFPFFNKNLTWKDSSIKNLLIWWIFWVIFIWLQLFKFWNDYFPWITLWISFTIFAIYFFILWYIFIQKVWLNNLKKEVSYKNSLYTYLLISISLFSISIALIFSKSPEIISLIWLLEATILFFFHTKTKESKIFDAWIILFIIWIVKLINLKSYVSSWDLLFLIPFSIIFVSFILNIKFVDKITNSIRKNIHDILHVIWIISLAFLLVKIIPSTWHWWSTLWISIFVFIIWIVYSYFNSHILKIFFISCLWFVLINQVWNFDSINYRLEKDNLNYLMILQYISTILISTIIILWNKINKVKIYNDILNIILSIYTLTIVSIYIYDLIPNTFAVTIFWWVLSVVLLINWISRDLIKLRTIWLYLLSLVLWKIFLYDLWYWLDDAVTRIAALIILWVLLIFVSTRYSKKYWKNLTWEFDIKNLSAK